MSGLRPNESGLSPRAWARIAGVGYLITIVLGATEQMAIRGRIYVVGDAAATAANLRSMDFLWRLGIASEMVLLISTVVTLTVLYAFLRPVDRMLARLMICFAIVGLTIEAAFTLRLVEALMPLGKAAYWKAFTPEQLDAMVVMAIRAHGSGFGIALLFFGPFFLAAGSLIYKSGLFPKAIGLLYLLPGAGYLVSSFALILAPAFGNKYYFVLASPAIIGEGALCVYLLWKGVRAATWEDIEHRQVAVGGTSVLKTPRTHPDAP